eukprot:TRINITY_DN2990_c3_g1_i2.p1 TRINITY_DN2990_c3_g1~~TRINITY_DN2990_c3_g1_i2.p1  ORF type:complete len:415 (+),score=54.80 TRINITY_DN2990_c3_g1_i2:64-1245(+)
MPQQRKKGSQNGYNQQSESNASSRKKYRFKVGDRVLCRTGDGWESGKIVKVGYVNPGDTTVHPYQVSLNGRLIYVPWDGDECCKLHNVAWWEDAMDREDLSDEEGCTLLKKLCKGKDVNEKNHYGNAATHTAMEYGWLAGVKQLLKLRADPNLAGEKSIRILHMAVWRRNLPFINHLLDARASVNLQDEDPDKDPSYESKSFEERQWHRSALHYASERSEELTKLMLEKRADINLADAQLKQPLHIAIEANLPDVVDLLLKRKADVNTGNHTLGLSSTPLVDAAYRKDIDLVRKLIAARSDVNHLGKQGMTPLHQAVRGRNPETVKLLVDSKADVNIKAMGQTAAQLAAKNRLDEVAPILGGDVVGSDSASDKPPPRSAIDLDEEMRKRLFLD